MELAVCGEPHAVARTAVRLADRTDETNDALRARQAIIHRLIGWIRVLDRAQGAECTLNFLFALAIRNVAINRELGFGPGAERHQFDEAHLPVVLKRQPRQLDHIVVVVAARNDRVHFHGRETRGFGRLDAAPNGLRVEEAHQSLSALRIQRVQMDVDPFQPRILERLRQFIEQQAIGRHAQIVRAVHAGNPRRDLDQVWAQGRLAPGQAELAETDGRRRTYDLFNLLWREKFFALDKGQPVQRHAVQAAQVAAVRQRDAQIVDVAQV